MLNLNIQVQNVQVEQQAPISVYYKVFAPTSDGRMVPTLIRNSGTSRAKDTFISLLSKSRSLILNITAQITDDKWIQLAPQSTLTFTKKVSQDKLRNDVSDIVKQVMHQIAQDDNHDLYEKISIDLIATNKDTNIKLQESESTQEVTEINEEDDESFPF